MKKKKKQRGANVEAPATPDVFPQETPAEPFAQDPQEAWDAPADAPEEYAPVDAWDAPESEAQEADFAPGEPYMQDDGLDGGEPYAQDEDFAGGEPYAQDVDFAPDEPELDAPFSAPHGSYMPPPSDLDDEPAEDGGQDDRPAPITIFRPRTRRPNFILSVIVSTLRLICVLVIVLSLAGAGALVGIGKAYVETAPTLDLAKIDDQAQTSFIYDAQGNLITDYKGTEDRIMVSIDEIPTQLQNAFVAVEDARFFTHNGVDVKRIIGAFISNMSSDSQQGGSTITQQLIKQTVLSDEQSYKRKLQEAYLAMQLETRYTKEQILEAYLNTIFLGGSYYGVKVAANGYFGKELNELTLRECAMLAGLTRSPNYYNPRKNFYTRNTEDNSATAKITNDRTDYVLRMMYENQFITREQYEAALDPSTATVLETSPVSTDMYDYAYYVEYAITDVVDTFLELNQLEDTSANRYAMENKLRTGGYSVYLCIDTELQDILEDTLANWDDYPRTRNPSDAVYRARNADGTYTEIPQPQVGAAILDYRTGELKAIAGGRYAPTQRKTLNRASDINMPVGSAIKPISVYAPAVDLGGSPASIIYNMPVPIKGWTVDGKDSFPQNYGGGGYKGPETFREALRQSHNTAAAQALMTYVGVERSAQYLRLMGVDDKNIIEGGFGLALGSSGLTPIQMAVAFGTLANKGVYLEPLSFSKIIDSNGNVIVDAHAIQEKRQVFKASTAYLVVDMLKGVVSSGTGSKAKISSQIVAGKTGTNSDARGVTFAGMTGWYAAALWIGHDNYQPLTSKATGGNDAAPLWQSFMEKIHKAKGLDSREIIDGSPEDYGLVKATTCGVSGQLATDACRHDINGYSTVTDYWDPANVPTQYCSMHSELPICTVSGRLATEYCPSNVVENRAIVVIPQGHPLYDYTESYGSVIRQYLGPFATSKDSSAISTTVCDVHTSDWVYQNSVNAQSLRDEAYNLTIDAYNRVGAASAWLSAEQLQSVNTAIYAVEAVIYSDYIDTATLQNAVDNLRWALSNAGI